MRELERIPSDTPAQEPALPPTAVIGRGRVGGSIASAAAVCGIDVRQAGREKFDQACEESEVALLCVPDAEIAAAAERAAGHCPPLRFVGHVSGATGLAALQSAARAGAATFSLHPLQTIPDDRSAIGGVPAAIAGSDSEAVALAARLASALGMEPFEVPEELRPAYHAAASIASNFLVALEESAVVVLERAGIENGRELLAPLVLRSAANWAERGGEALTGPIARGDRETVARHSEALREHAPEILALYEALAERASAIAARQQEG